MTTGQTSPRGPTTAASEAETRLGWRMAGLAFTLSSEVAAGAIVGLVIDHFAKTAPRWLLIGAIAGISVGLLSFIRGAIALNRIVSQNERDRAARGIPPPPPLPPEPDEVSEADQQDIDKLLNDWQKHEKP